MVNSHKTTRVIYRAWLQSHSQWSVQIQPDLQTARQVNNKAMEKVQKVFISYGLLCLFYSNYISYICGRKNVGGFVDPGWSEDTRCFWQQQNPFVFITCHISCFNIWFLTKHLPCNLSQGCRAVGSLTTAAVNMQRVSSITLGCNVPKFCCSPSS